MTSEEEEIFCDVESSVQGLSGSKEESDDDAPPKHQNTQFIFSIEEECYLLQEEDY